MPFTGREHIDVPAAGRRTAAGTPSHLMSENRQPLSARGGRLGRVVPDFDSCYRAVRSRDERFDGWFFTAVRTTGIYCRPSCPAITPKRANVSFFRSAAAAQRAGYRACKRCRPDASPGSPDWDVRADVVGRALRLIGDGLVDREGVPGLAARLGYSARQVHRVLVESVGAGPIALARAQRAQTARVLLETTDLPAADVAFAAGFASVRQFNDTVRDVFASTPSQLRAGRRPAGDAEPGTIALRLPYREPMDLSATLQFLGARAVPGVEQWTGEEYCRVLRAPHGPALVRLRPGDGHVACRLRLADQRDLVSVVARVRRLLDLDADPQAVDEALSADPRLAPLVIKRPGLRSPGAVDGFEMAVRAVVGQQIRVRGARTVLGRITSALGETAFDGEPWLLFPSAEALAAADPAALPMPRARARTVQALAEAFATSVLLLDPGVDRDETASALRALPGVGAWTADYVRMRALGDPDVLLGTDLGVRAAAAEHDLDLRDGRPDWAPWRSYATHHLWASHPMKETP
jgi:AraC family transcriptional regulator of adaptative response / DNA-3-methyladenine glycosylase II